MPVDVSRSAGSKPLMGNAFWRLRHLSGGACIAVCIAAGASFVALWLGVVGHRQFIDDVDGLGPRVDDLGLQQNSAAVQAWRAYCIILSPLTFDVLAFLSALASVARGAWRDAACVVLAVVGGQVIVTAVKGATDRPRPGALGGTAVSSSFPSDHAASALIGVLVLLAVWAPTLRTHIKRRVLVTGAGATLVALLGVGRVVVHAHHPSDVIAGYALGTFWATGCLLGIGAVSWSRTSDGHRRQDKSVGP